MSELADRVGAAIESIGWSFEVSPDAPEGEHHWLLDNPDRTLDHPVLLLVHDGPSTIVCYSVSLDDVAIEHRPAAIEFVTRANYGLLEGNFELDLADGEVRFKTSQHVELPDRLDAELAHMLAFNCAVFSVYRDALVAVATGAASPTEAIASVESS